MIRTIRTEDAAAVARVCEAALGHSAATEQVARQAEALARDSHYYIAVFEGDCGEGVLGFIQAEKYSLLYGGDGWNIIALAVAPEVQRQGVGRRLLEALEGHARSLGGTFIRLNSNVTRAEAHEFYRHLGYVCDKTQKRFIKRFRTKATQIDLRG